MWLFKLMGAMLLVYSGVATSCELNRRATAALTQNEGMLALLRTVRGQIECFARPISEILASCDAEMLFACGYRGEGMPSDLSTLLKACRGSDVDTIRIVTRFAEEFGRGHREDEVRACDYTLELLEARRQTLSADLPVTKKRNTVLSVCGAMALALLLL